MHTCITLVIWSARLVVARSHVSGALSSSFVHLHILPVYQFVQIYTLWQRPVESCVVQRYRKVQMVGSTVMYNFVGGRGVDEM